MSFLQQFSRYVKNWGAVPPYSVLVTISHGVSLDAWAGLKNGGSCDLLVHLRHDSVNKKRDDNFLDRQVPQGGPTNTSSGEIAQRPMDCLAVPVIS